MISKIILSILLFVLFKTEITATNDVQKACKTYSDEQTNQLTLFCGPDDNLKAIPSNIDPSIQVSSFKKLTLAIFS